MQVNVCNNGSVVVNGREITSTTIDGKTFYSITDLKNSIKGENHKDIHLIMRNERFVRMVEELCDVKLRRLPNMVRCYKDKKIYYTLGRREETIVLCIDKMFYLLLCELCDSFHISMLKKSFESFDNQ